MTERVDRCIVLFFLFLLGLQRVCKVNDFTYVPVKLVTS